MQKTKVLMVTHGFLPENVGGTEIYTYTLSKSLIQHDYEVTVITALKDMILPRYKIITTMFEGIKVIKIVNSPFYAKSFADHFVDIRIDEIFKKILTQEKPNLIHFQHVAYLSGNLIEIAHQMNIPSVFTLHDYWYICYRSYLLRPGCRMCPGPDRGAHCATCHDDSTPNPIAVPTSPILLKVISFPPVQSLFVKTLNKTPKPIISRAIKLLFKNPKPGENGMPISESFLVNSKFRYDFFKEQFKYPKFVLSPSYHLKNRYENEGYREITVLPLGFQPAEFVETPPFNEKLKLAFIGNIERHKGVTVIFRDLLRLQKLDQVEINIYGKAKDIIYSSEVKRLARQYPQEVIKFHGGYRSDQDLKKIFSQIHMVVFPSIWEENAPLVLREALLHGVPVLASKLGGVPEVIKNGVNGYLFDPFKEGDLLEKINHIIKYPQVLETLTQGARNSKIESMEHHLFKITDIYNRALSGT